MFPIKDCPLIPAKREKEGTSPIPPKSPIH